MKVELRGTIRASLGTSAVEVEVPAAGVPLSQLLECVARAYPRARRYLRDSPDGAVLRVFHNGSVAAVGDDPLVRPEDSVLLMHAVAGGVHSPAA
jgi:molybdopterin converting factor small subunit